MQAYVTPAALSPHMRTSQCCSHLCCLSSLKISYVYVYVYMCIYMYIFCFIYLFLIYFFLPCFILVLFLCFLTPQRTYCLFPLLFPSCSSVVLPAVLCCVLWSVCTVCFVGEHLHCTLRGGGPASYIDIKDSF